MLCLKFEIVITTLIKVQIFFKPFSLNKITFYVLGYFIFLKKKEVQTKTDKWWIIYVDFVKVECKYIFLEK